MILSTVGRGGEGDVGQRIRDEILVIQVDMIFIYFSLEFCIFLFSLH
jgi:alpha-glucan,water dikinase